MSDFNRHTAVRIAAASILVAITASPLAWWLARQSTEASVVSLAVEETYRVSQYFDFFALANEQSRVAAREAASRIAGGLFDIAEIYSPSGEKLGERNTPDGEAMEALLPPHGRVHSSKPSYESIELPGGQWVLRVFIPLRHDSSSSVLGYFEGVRLVSKWEREHIRSNALGAAIIAALASVVCGLLIYPIVTHLAGENERKKREVIDSHISMMEALGRAIAKRDSDTGAHNYRVAWIAVCIAERLGMPRVAMQSLIAGSFLHDIGKIGIPDSILLKPGKLLPEELVIMRSHVAKGEEIVRGMGWLDGAQTIVAGHHEKWDGSGYPRALKGEAIPLAARIFAVADVFDALCSHRPYKQPMNFEQAMAILEKDTGSHFDPTVMAAFQVIARKVYDTLANCDEASARDLLQEQIHKYFEV